MGWTLSRMILNALNLHSSYKKTGQFRYFAICELWLRTYEDTIILKI